MRTSYKMAFLLSLFGITKSNANETILKIDSTQELSKSFLIKQEIDDLFKVGILQYDSKTRTIHIKENESFLESSDQVEEIILAIRNIYGSDLKIKEISPKKMSLSTQDRGN